ncbi:DNA-binding transcriptional regulator Fis [Gammaproteobacteria bacterium]|nr:DNA-binding transcriptional regulator Fis [SAR86 cluster bacterium]MDB3880585.1 DNA-binding transcriptional regulator Fis [Gammaproteobacteria bacterium]MDB3976597.1 DNA-binding transcriptional regulator Fis [Gammaproteobacteria bacterium]MDC0569767.1 DNA-binding transcriptional regulator Fis [Gammaproteobacteria bacterium]MDC0577578.1 DNA-binding transcriptional regulator Fis [Gammaproteobacteria bacterium]
MAQKNKKKFNGEGRQLSHQVSKSMRRYFKELDGERASDIYNMVLKEVELPLLEIVMRECNDNQSKASQILGINRGTLRTKLKEHKLL